MLIKIILILFTFVLSVLSKNDTPNVLIFLVDDWGWGDLGANVENNGFKTSKTPFMDTFARSNLRFTDFHSAAAICTPSRAALLTGRLGLRTGTTMLFGPTSVGGLPKTEVLLSSMFKQKNYTTFAIGKWHLGHHGDYHPNKRDFDHYVGVPYSLDQGCLDFPGYILPPRKACVNEESFLGLGLPLYRDQKIIEQPVNIQELTNKYISEFKQRILEVKKNNAKFFGYIPFSHLHVPLGYNKNYDNVTDTVFGNTLRELDDSFRIMIDTLKEVGLYENTLIWLYGDNGPWEMECQYAGTPGPFQGIWQKKSGGGGTSWKTTIWEGGHRVPGIVSWPKMIKDGRISNALVSALDIVPTLSNLIGFKLPKDRNFDGVDLSDMLVDAVQSVNEVLYHPKSDGISGDITAIRYKNFKAIYESGNKKNVGACHVKPAPRIQHNPPLLFDLEKDPAEEYPLDISIDRYKEIVDLINVYKKIKLADISNDFKSFVDKRTSPLVEPCCNKHHKHCRC